MKLGVYTVLLGEQSLEEALKYLSDLGVQAVEIGTGGFPGTAHANPDELLESPDKLKEFKDLIAKYDMEISALAVMEMLFTPKRI